MKATTHVETYVLDGVAKYTYRGKGWEGFVCQHVKGDPGVDCYKKPWGALCVVCSKKLTGLMCFLRDRPTH